MTEHLYILSATTAAIAVAHTALGPAHYLPFVMMSRAGKWSLSRTCFITAACGLAHVLGSLLLGLIGIIFGTALMQIQALEHVRGHLAAWLLIGFGIAYATWGTYRLWKENPVQCQHDQAKTPLLLCLLFLLCPAEPLVPLLMYPAAIGSMSGIIAVTTIFAIVSIITMVGIVFVLCTGLQRINLGSHERFVPVIAGVTIILCGAFLHLTC